MALPTFNPQEHIGYLFGFNGQMRSIIGPQDTRTEMSDSRKTQFSPCRNYRYTLWREWDCDSLTGTSDDSFKAHEFVMFIGLNPSTADETNDDPTIRRCIGFAKSWGYGALCMTNLFALRATDPNVMKNHPSPIGEDNDHYLLLKAVEAGLIVAAWGNDGKHWNRGLKVIEKLQGVRATIWHFGLTSKQQPKHPLYLSKNSKLSML